MSKALTCFFGIHDWVTISDTYYDDEGEVLCYVPRYKICRDCELVKDV